MTAVVASIRPDSWNIPLFLHVFGAMVLVGIAFAAVCALLFAGSRADPDVMRRFAFRSLLIGGVPAYLVMRAGAEWMYSKEFGDVDDDPTWIGIGYITADLGLLLLLVALVCSGIAARKSSSALGKAAGIVIALALIGWLVAIWAMGGKP